jgi:hypothetical protein
MKRWCLSCSLVFLLFSTPLPAQQEYLIGGGDTLQITSGKRRAQPDGRAFDGQIAPR